MKEIKFKFKSKDEFYHRERMGFKPNTMRLIDLEDERFLDLICYAHEGFDKELRIEIVNSETNDYFIREITDISLFSGWMIISWKHPEVSH